MPFKSEAQKRWMYATHPAMAEKWQKHTPKGKRLPKKLHPKKRVGMSENVAILFGPMPLAEGEYPWTKRASIASAGVLLGLLAARSMGHKGDYVPPPAPAPMAQKVDPSPSATGPSLADAPAEEPFQKDILTLQEAKEFISPSEGTRSKVYHDSRGKKTVGVGINLNSPGAAKLLRDAGVNYTAVKTGQRRLSAGEIDTLFTRKVQDAMAAGPRLLQTWDDQPKTVQLAVVDMIYNLGPTGFSHLDTARDALEAKDYRRAATVLTRTAWYRQVGARAENVVAMIRSAGEPTVAMRESIETLFGEF